MKTTNLLLFSLVLSASLLSLEGWAQRVDTRPVDQGLKIKDLSLSENECRPFDLEKKGHALDKVPFSHQFYANCYSAAATNMLNTWIKSKVTPEMGDVDKYLVSPHHLAIVYALHFKGKEFPSPASWQSDWTRKKVGTLSQKEFFHKNKFSQEKTPELKKQMEDLIINRLYYFSEYGGGVATSSIKNAINQNICPYKRVEKAFKTKEKGQEFFRDSRGVYMEFLKNYNELGSEKALKLSAKKLNTIFKNLQLPDASITLEDFQNAVMPNGNIDETDPLYYIDQVFLNLCSKSKTHGPVKLKDVLAEYNIFELPTPSTVLKSKGPAMNRSTIEAHYERAISTGESQLPMSISFAGHAMWKGVDQLAWKWDDKIKSWKQDPKYGGHQAVISGRRWNKKTNTCEYALRNSFHLGETAQGWQIDETNKYRVWIKDTYLFASINSFYHFLSE